MSIQLQTVSAFLNELSVKSPTPGGGAVAGLFCAVSSALGNMVVAYSEGKASLKEHEQLHQDCMTFLMKAVEESLLLADADAEAYQKVSDLWRLPENDALRASKWDETFIEAATIPLKTMELSERVLITLNTLVGKSNAMLNSDLAIAAVAAESAARACYYTAQINIKEIKDESSKQELTLRCEALTSSCKEKAADIEASCGV